MQAKQILTATLLLLSCTTIAQNNKFNDTDRENFFRFGIKGGLNVNKITGQSYKQGFNYNYQVGGFLQFNVNKRFGIQPEVNLVQGSSELTNDASTIYDDLFRDGGQKKASLSYLEIPVLLNINVGLSKHVKVQVGPALGALLKQTVDSLKTGVGNIYKNAEWSAIGGLWIQLPLINFGARYKLGLTNMNATSNQQVWKNQAIQIFIGLTF